MPTHTTAAAITTLARLMQTICRSLRLTSGTPLGGDRGRNRRRPLLFARQRSGDWAVVAMAAGAVSPTLRRVWQAWTPKSNQSDSLAAAAAPV